MTIAQAFVKFIEKKGYGVFGQNIFLYRVPNSIKTQTELLWIIPSGGQPVSINKTGELIKEYQFMVYYRSNSAEKVDAVMSDLEEVLNCSTCVDLQGFELISLKVTQFPADQDLDSENRMVGSLQATIQVYASCQNIES